MRADFFERVEVGAPDGPNLYRAPRGDRRCRTCMTQQNERRDRRKVRF